MARVVRPAFLTGSVLLVAGLLWVVTIFRGWAELWPNVLDKPFTASAVAVLGVVLIRLAMGLRAKVMPDRQEMVPADRPLGPDDFADMMPSAHALQGKTPAKEVGPGDREPAPLLEPAIRPVIPEPDEEALGPVAIAMAAFERMQQESRRADAAAQLRTGFRIAAPGRETRSWIGGAPMMPEHVPWPVLRGAPGVFLAQIDLAELPSDLWGGLGPREGDLLLFAAADPAQEICAMHMPERGRVRQTPTATPTLYGAKSPEMRLAELIGPKITLAPRWALEVEPARTGPRARPGSARSAFCASGQLDDPALYPFDWPMVFALLDSLGVALRRALKTTKGPKDERDARLVTLAKLRLLTKQTEARAEAAVFDEDAADDILTALADLTNEGWSDGKPAQSLLSLPMFRTYRSLLETYARHLVAEKPRALPKALSRSLMPVWQQETEHATVVFGGMSGDEVVLARLYPTAMTGWHGAWNRPLTLTLSREALEHGDFDELQIKEMHALPSQ